MLKFRSGSQEAFDIKSLAYAMLHRRPWFKLKPRPTSKLKSGRAYSTRSPVILIGIFRCNLPSAEKCLFSPQYSRILAGNDIKLLKGLGMMRSSAHPKPARKPVPMVKLLWSGFSQKMPWSIQQRCMLFSNPNVVSIMRPSVLVACTAGAVASSSVKIMAVVFMCGFTFGWYSSNIYTIMNEKGQRQWMTGIVGR